MVKRCCRFYDIFSSFLDSLLDVSHCTITHNSDEILSSPTLDEPGLSFLGPDGMLAIGVTTLKLFLNLVLIV